MKCNFILFPSLDIVSKHPTFETLEWDAIDLIIR